ncbi:ABC transporter substrate-binding protein [Ornithinibacillus sp. 4-3]|uniref:ABC transporter substrate-binding protein n=1 Tax=Ornithinibacillus sp. 4-3 TaxID=3231488 RepID=A0AB39HM99_9BACI
MKVINKTLLLMFLAVLLVLAACSNNDDNSSDNNSEGSNDNNESSGEQTAGGDLQFVLNTQPPTIDPIMSTATATRDISRHIYETLVTIDSAYEPQPMLAESWEISEDGLTYTFNLREGIKFHNGEEMTADDVVASMNRWLERSSTAQSLIGEGTFEEVDKYTVELKLQEPSIFVLLALGGTLQFPGIMPKEIVEAATETGVEEHIGTAPFKFVEWKQDQYVHLEKFEDYTPREETADGLAGERIAYFDNVYINFVPDPNTQLGGVTTGQYHIGHGMSYDMFDQLESAEDVEAVAPIIGQYGIVFNKFEGQFAEVKMRQAVNAALNLEDIANAALGGKYRMSSSYMQVEQEAWASTEGEELYNNPDPDKVQALLDEINYDGEPLTFITSREYSYMYDSAVIIKEQLEQVGIKVDLEVYDWATVLTLRDDPSKWDLLITGFPMTMTPVEQLFYNDTWIDGPEDEKTEQLLKDIATADTIEEAKVFWDELQGHSWEILPILKISDYTTVMGVNKNIEGFLYLDGPVFWNTSLNQ